MLHSNITGLGPCYNTRISKREQMCLLLRARLCRSANGSQHAMQHMLPDQFLRSSVVNYGCKIGHLRLTSSNAFVTNFDHTLVFQYYL